MSGGASLLDASNFSSAFNLNLNVNQQDVFSLHE